MKEAFLFTVLLCSRSLGHRESKDGRADLARGNQICVKLSDLFLSLSLFFFFFFKFFHRWNYISRSISIDRDREIFLFRISRDDGPLHDIADDRKESLNARSTFYNRLRLHQ